MVNIMKKLLIFPYSKEIIPILNHIELLKDIKEIIVLAFQLPMLHNFNQHISFESIQYMEMFIEEVDIVWIVNDDFTTNIDKYIDRCIKHTIKLKKIIKWTRDRKIPDELKKYPYMQKCLVNDNMLTTHRGQIDPQIYPLKTPVIFILGFSKDLMQYNTLLSLKVELDKQSIRTYTIASKRYKDFPDIETYPDFYYNTKYTISDKILLLNHFLKQLENTICPELILMEIYGGIGVFSDKLINDFGADLFCVSQAASADCCVLNIPIRDYEENELKSIQRMLQNKFNIFIDYFNIVNYKVCIAESERKHRFSYLTVDNNEVDNVISKLKLSNVFNISHHLDSQKLTNKIVNQLVSYNVNRVF